MFLVFLCLPSTRRKKKNGLSNKITKLLTIGYELNDDIEQYGVANQSVRDVLCVFLSAVPVEAVLMAILKLYLESLLSILAQLLAKAIHESFLLVGGKQVVLLRPLFAQSNLYVFAVRLDPILSSFLLDGEQADACEAA